MRITTALLSVIATTALIAGTSVPAGAATQTRTDAAGDTTNGGSFPSGGAAPRSIRDAADVLTLRGVHGDGELTFTFTLADVGSAQNLTSFGAVVRIVTPTEADYEATLRVDDGVRQVALVRRDRESDVDCDGLAGRVFSSRDQYVVTVPRSCVRNPREVLFGGAAFASNSGDSSEVGFAYDDARRDGNANEGVRLGTRALKNN